MCPSLNLNYKNYILTLVYNNSGCLKKEKYFSIYFPEYKLFKQI